MESATSTVLSEQKSVTLKEAIDRDGVPPAPSSKQRRLMDVHVTAYPSLVNTTMLPHHATTVKDFSSIDPVKYRKEHTVRDNNAGSYAEKEDHVLDMVSTNQFANRITQMGVRMRAERAKNADGTALSVQTLDARGYHSRFLAPPFDERSTYRWDYCQQDVEGFRDTVHRTQLATYRDDWTDNEKADVDASMKAPYLTLPVSSDRLKDKSTIYRKDFMPEAGQEEYRLLSHRTHLGDLGTTFAYSGYAVDDPRRVVSYNPAVASVKGMHSLVDKSFTPRAPHAAAATTAAKPSAREELELLRAMRRETTRRSVAANHASSTAARPSMGTLGRVSGGSTDSTSNPVVIPGIKGSGYRRAPKDNDDYVYLPRDHFCYQAVDNF